MASTRKGYKVSATVIPVNDLIPVADSNDIAGNLMYFDNLADINNIPITKRKLGMFVYVSNEGKHYKLIDNKPVLDNDCWEEYELVSKKYVDDAIDAKTIDLSGYETTQHAEDTYAKKNEIPTVPDVSNFITTSELHELVSVTTSSLNVEDNTDTEINIQLELPKDALIIQVNAIAEVEETKEDDTPILATNAFTTTSTPINGMTITDYGAKINGCAEPTSENDFVTYGKEGISNE